MNLRFLVSLVLLCAALGCAHDRGFPPGYRAERDGPVYYWVDAEGYRSITPHRSLERCKSHAWHFHHTYNANLHTLWKHHYE